MRTNAQICLEDAAGRIRLRLDGIRIGRDWQIILHGGDAHLGAAAIADGRQEQAGCAGLELPGHREGSLAEGLARRAAATLGCAVCVSCGIHYDAISRAEIGLVFGLARRLEEKFLQQAREADMIAADDLSEMESYLSSGRFEADFRAADEKRRHEMLEILEKLMDLGEIADRVGTAIIYRRMGGGLIDSKRDEN